MGIFWQKDSDLDANYTAHSGINRTNHRRRNGLYILSKVVYANPYRNFFTAFAFYFYGNRFFTI